jgi:O-antigen ligase
MLACFAVFAYRRRRGRLSIVLIAVMLAGMLTTGTRGAIAAFLSAVLAVALLTALRPLLGAPVVGVRPVSKRGVLSLGALVIAAFVAIPASMPAVDRLVLDDHHRTNDIAMRLANWQEGLDRWADRDSLFAQLFGAGFRSGGFTEHKGIYDTSHNAYIEALLDFGAVGLLLFGTFLAVTLTRFSWGLLRRPNQRLLAFAITGLIVLVVHNGSQVFFWTPDIAVLMVLLLTCGELALRERIHRVVVVDHYPRLVPVNGLAATAGDLIPGNPHAVAGRHKTMRPYRRVRATQAV